MTSFHQIMTSVQVVGFRMERLISIIYVTAHRCAVGMKKLPYGRAPNL